MCTSTKGRGKKKPMAMFILHLDVLHVQRDTFKIQHFCFVYMHDVNESLYSLKISIILSQNTSSIYIHIYAFGEFIIGSISNFQGPQAKYSGKC